MKIDVQQLRKDFLEGDNYFMEVISEKFGTYCIEYLCTNYNCSQNVAHDLFIDTIIDLRERIIQEKVAQIVNLKSYLLGSCINSFKLLIRQERRKFDNKEEIKTRFYSNDLNYLENRMKSERQKELEEIMLKTFRQLGKKCQVILRLYYLEGHKMDEIADILDLASSDVAKTLKSRCYKKWLDLITALRKKYHTD